MNRSTARHVVPDATTSRERAAHAVEGIASAWGDLDRPRTGDDGGVPTDWPHGGTTAGGFDGSRADEGDRSTPQGPTCDPPLVCGGRVKKSSIDAHQAHEVSPRRLARSDDGRQRRGPRRDGDDRDDASTWGRTGDERQESFGGGGGGTRRGTGRAAGKDGRSPGRCSGAARSQVCADKIDDIN